MDSYVGPMIMDCEEKCEVPENMTMTPMPPSHHNWSDIIRCPNCGQCFSVETNECQS